MRNSLFLQMKNFSLNLEDKRFSIDSIPKDETKKFYTLYEDDTSLYILIPASHVERKDVMMIVGPAGTVFVPYSKKDTTVQKVWYPKAKYKQELKQIQKMLFGKFALFVLIAFALALIAAWYTLKPLRSSLRLLEDFIKDIIHDLNTPLSSIRLNLKMVESQDEEIESIRTAAETIEMLHHNLDAYIKEQHQREEVFDAKEVVLKYIAFFTPLYDYLEWDVQMEEMMLSTDKQAFSRIVYNLLSNACKYNTSNGKIKINLKGSLLTIENSSYGVKHPERVFERFYKESERGLGIGLHIVEKLTKSLGIEKSFRVKDNRVIVRLECQKLMVT